MYGESGLAAGSFPLRFFFFLSFFFSVAFVPFGELSVLDIPIWFLSADT
jgi:hypothetical protein